jgi:hypothetical protein
MTAKHIKTNNMKISVHRAKEKDHYILSINAAGQMPMTVTLERSQARELIMKLDNKIIP